MSQQLHDKAYDIHLTWEAEQLIYVITLRQHWFR